MGMPFHKKKKVNRRLFFSVLLTYLIILSVIVILFVIGFSYSIRQIERDMGSLQISYLEKIQQELDLRMSSISKISNFLASQKITATVLEFKSEEPSNQPDYLALNKIISEQNKLINFQGETAIYSQKTNSIFTGLYRYRNDNLDIYTKRLGLTPTEFYNFLDKAKSHSTFSILHSGTSKAEIVYLVPVFDTTFQRSGTVITHLSMPYLQDALNITNWIDGTICIVENEDEYLYIDDGNNDTALSYPAKPDYSQVVLNGTPLHSTINGKTYTSVGLRSANSSWEYYFSIPTREFFRSSGFYFVWFLIILLFAILSGLLLSLTFSQRLSKPLKGILSSLKLNDSVGYAEAVNSLEKAILSYRNELSDTRTQLMRGQRQEKADFIYELCSGKISPSQLEEKKELYGISLEDAPLYLIVFCCTDADTSPFSRDGVLDANLLLYASCNVISEKLCTNHGVAVCREGKVYCLYQPSASTDIEKLHEHLDEIRRFHQEILQVNLHIFCAGHGERLMDLPELLFRIEELSLYKSFWNNDVPDILYYDEIEDLNDTQEEGNHLSTEKRFVNMLAIQDYKGAYKVLKDYLQSGISKDFRLAQVERLKIFGLIASFISDFSTSSPISMDSKDLDQFNLDLRELLTEKSLHKLQEKIDSVFQIVITNQEKKLSSDLPPWIQDIHKYIEEHYDDPQLDVSFLAKTFSVNISRLSSAYKKATSIGVLDNIHLMRITKAKELLNQGMSVQQISLHVGYTESRALIRAFKRYEGITPGQYQKGLSNHRPLE